VNSWRFREARLVRVTMRVGAKRASRQHYLAKRASLH
ncbi:hypothetical protein CLOM_g19201, partial [Closterium sp. NIES-68]